MRRSPALLQRAMLTGITLSVLLASGCASGRTRLSVGNVSEGPILNVRVHAEGEELMSAPRLAMRSSTPLARLTEPPSGDTTVEWDAADGRTYRQPVATPKPLPADFRGILYIEIGRDNKAKLFAIPKARNGQHDIPWTRPESWEGYPGIPGMTHD